MPANWSVQVQRIHSDATKTQDLEIVAVLLENTRSTKPRISSASGLLRACCPSGGLDACCAGRLMPSASEADRGLTGFAIELRIGQHYWRPPQLALYFPLVQA
jgi:hypothetical protein